MDAPPELLITLSLITITNLLTKNPNHNYDSLFSLFTFLDSLHQTTGVKLHSLVE